VTYPTQISVPEALERLQARAPKLEREEVPLGAALGRTLGTPLRSRVDHSSVANSALDGYACRAADTAAASRSAPVTLTLVGDVPAGSSYAGVVGPGEAVAIYTGAPVPTGADAIIGVELTERSETHVTLFRPASPRDIRPRAQDLKTGEVYLEAGRTLRAAEIAVAAAMGYPVVPVVRRPRVGILATGDELVEPGDAIRDGQVYNSNSYGLAALVAGAGGEPVSLPNVRDDLGLLEAALNNLQLDLLLTSGGVSMGRYDFVRDLLFGQGTVHFWKVAMKPGGPVLFGSFRGLDVLGLPGNPVSSLVVFTLLGRAYLAAALESTDPLPYHVRRPAVAETPFADSGFKETFARAVLTPDPARGLLARSTGTQSSGVLRSLLLADALAVVPPHIPIAVGDPLEVIAL
jgi:molybdopterin molybdotransferase